MPDFIDRDTFSFVEKLASFEGAISDLKKQEREAEDEAPHSVKRSELLLLPIDVPDQDSYEPETDDYLKKERDEILDQMRSSRAGFSNFKKRNNEAIMKRVEGDDL